MPAHRWSSEEIKAIKHKKKLQRERRLREIAARTGIHQGNAIDELVDIMNQRMEKKIDLFGEDEK